MKWLHDWLSSHSQQLLNSELAQIERKSSGFFCRLAQDIFFPIWTENSLDEDMKGLLIKFTYGQKLDPK